MPKAGDRREDDRGIYVWKVPSDGGEGWWSQIEDQEIASLRTPLCCPSCGNLLDNWSASFYNRWGVCADCYYDFLEGRDLKLSSNSERAAYCKGKIEEKKNKQ